MVYVCFPIKSICVWDRSNYKVKILFNALIGVTYFLNNLLDAMALLQHFFWEHVSGFGHFLFRSFMDKRKEHIKKKRHLEVCIALRWWHWQWRCASPHHSGRWLRLLKAMCPGASGAVTVHLQNTPAALLRCSVQRTLRQHKKQSQWC